MEPMHPTHVASRTPLATHGGGPRAPRRRRLRGWLGRVTGAMMMMVAVVGLTAPQPAAAGCGTWWNPICWVEAGLDYAWDTVQGVLELTWDVVTLNPAEFFEDIQEVAYNQICAPGFSLLSLAVANGLEEDFDDCASPPHPIEPEVLDKLKLYVKSPLESVRVHEGCNLNADVIPGNDESSRDAITFGEHIYFKPNHYHPADPAGFAMLAHELTHVLQYRQKGFADFTCQYATHCALGLHQGCEIEQSAYDYQALVLDDQEKDGDGVFSPVDNCQYGFNPGQEDTDGDGVGNACDSKYKSDIVWRYVDGTVTIWHDGSPVGTTWHGGPDQYWQIQGVGDFDGNGKSDIVWRHVDGTVAIWLTDNPVGTTWHGGPDQYWQIQGVGDFDGNGKSDIVWRHVDGTVAIWLTASSAGTAWPGILDQYWQIQGVGDFDGDGTSDIVWRHMDGTVAIWPAGHPAGTTWPGALMPYWQIQGVGEFDGNGLSDIVWRHVDGTVAIWHDGSPAWTTWHGGPDQYWQIQGVGEFDGNGLSDIVWRRVGGTVSIWLTGNPAGTVSTAVPDQYWQIQGFGKFD